MHHAPNAACLCARRAALAMLDTTLVAACERAAGHGQRSKLPPADPSRWNRTTWRRYLAEARTQNYLLAPHRRRLLAEISEMERAYALPVYRERRL